MNNIILSAFVLIGAILVLNPNKSESFALVGGASRIGNWIENNRANPNYLDYPPCFDLCPASIKMFDILNNHKLIQKYKPIFEAQSLFLCEEVYTKKRNCMNTMINDRIYDLEKLGWNPIDLTYYSKLEGIIGNSIKKLDKKIISLMLGTMTIMEQQINKMIELSNEEIKNVKKLANTFYIVHFNALSKLC